MGRKLKHPPKETHPKGWIDISEVAILLGIPYQRARDAVLATRCGPVKTIGRTRLVHRDSVVQMKRTLDASRK